MAYGEIERLVEERTAAIERASHECVLGSLEVEGARKPGLGHAHRAVHTALPGDPGRFRRDALLDRLRDKETLTLHAGVQRARSPEGTAGRILDLLADGTERSTATIAAALGVTSRTARPHLERLVEEGLVVAGLHAPGFW